MKRRNITLKEIIERLTQQGLRVDDFIDLPITSNQAVKVYPFSIHRVGDSFVFMAKEGVEKYLGIIYFIKETSVQERFIGELVKDLEWEEGISFKRCRVSHENAHSLRTLLEFTNPVLIGVQNSFGMGDRLGLANPGHLRAIKYTPIKVVLAQQSIREMERTHRTPDEVIDAASWAVFQEGFTQGFGADADHLKTTDDIDSTIASGFTMFTFDPGEHVVNEADSLSHQALGEYLKQCPWEELNTTLEDCMHQYADRRIQITDDFTLQPTREEVLRGLIKYGKVIAYVVKMYRHLKTNYPYNPTEIELSVDETESVTSPFEHYLVVRELKRLGIELVSLAPRFVGSFEKGIDYKGDPELFRQEYLKHVKIAETLGPYKLSVHSGSDKFTIYEQIGSLKQGHFHVKTAGTSYLEALRTVAMVEVSLFREILDYSREYYHESRVTYHVSARLENVPAAAQLSDSECVELFESNDDARQILHVSFGRVLTDMDSKGEYLFRDRLLHLLNENEEVYYENLRRHFTRHVWPFLSPRERNQDFYTQSEKV